MRLGITLYLAYVLTACSAGARIRRISVTEITLTGGFTVTCAPLPPDTAPAVYEFDVGLDQGEPTCKECLILTNDVYDFCKSDSSDSRYCACVRRAFVNACGKYDAQMKRKCRESKPIPISRIGAP
jgi:hypothetical protein